MADTKGVPGKGEYADRIRGLLDAAMEDPQTKQTQLEMVDDFFAEMVDVLPDAVERTLRKIFNVVSSGQSQAVQNRGFVRTISSGGDDGIGLVLHQDIPVNVRYTDFEAADIRKLPNYIKLHEAAREMNVAINVVALFEDEAMAAGQRPTLIVDITKTYDEGQKHNPGVYPEMQAPADDIQPLPEAPQATISPHASGKARFHL